MTLTPELPLHIDSTMISAFRQCPQKFYNEFILGLRPAALSVDLHAGACFASAIENTYSAYCREGLPLDKSLMRSFAHYMDQWGDFVPLKETPKSKERVWEAVEAYFREFSPATDPVQPYILEGRPSYEFTFGIPLPDEFPRHPSGDRFIYCGRFDMLGKWGEKLVVRDEKTTTSIGTTWANQWNLRSQFLGYVWACQQSGIPLDTVIVRGVGILKTKITLVEAIKSYPQHLIELWYHQLRRDILRIVACWQESFFDYNLADSCTSYGGCAFNSLCQSASPERWMDQFVVRRWNPLNKNPIDEKEKAA